MESFDLLKTANNLTPNRPVSPMLIHRKLLSFFKISQEIYNLDDSEWMMGTTKGIGHLFNEYIFCRLGGGYMLSVILLVLAAIDKL
ncbi:hypothetical protein T4D_11757 [Trichinella pseudospiralis]|uniref:Uncharacterized protein n=1 Tax=Trichinella pseudospiralis TaxID=6337 RepID=A0A0V1FEX5_TRIPS|nr:hypothetical protein T4D_11757 [Trichinella pseudospiralis]